MFFPGGNNAVAVKVLIQFNDLWLHILASVPLMQLPGECVCPEDASSANSCNLISTFDLKLVGGDVYPGNGRDHGVPYLSRGDSRADLKRLLVLHHYAYASTRWFLDHNSSCQDNASLENHMGEHKVPTLTCGSGAFESDSHW